MKIKFQYRYMGVTYPCLINATCVYYDPEDSTLNISDGIDWWETNMSPEEAKIYVDHFEIATISNHIFHLCK